MKTTWIFLQVRYRSSVVEVLYVHLIWVVLTTFGRYRKTQINTHTCSPRRIVADTRCWINVGLTLVQRRRRWTNVKPTLIQRIVSARMSLDSKLLLFIDIYFLQTLEEKPLLWYFKIETFLYIQSDYRQFTVNHYHRLFCSHYLQFKSAEKHGAAERILHKSQQWPAVTIIVFTITIQKETGCQWWDKYLYNNNAPESHPTTHCKIYSNFLSFLLENSRICSVS